jgi:hypothetical protein
LLIEKVRDIVKELEGCVASHKAGPAGREDGNEQG